MATIVERPMSALSASPVLPQRRRRPSVVEVIDVDLLDETSPSSSSRPTPRPASRQQEPIILSDSDEEAYTLSAASGSGSTRPGHRRQRLTSPPPPAIAGPSQIPPVPPVPRRYSGLTSLPSSSARRSPPFPSLPVVLPMNEPFPFEANVRPSPPAAGPSALHAHPNRHRRVPYVEPRAEPQPHHVPSLGLGGALMTINRTRDHDVSRRERHRHLVRSNTTTEPEPPGFLTRAGNTMRRLFTRINYHTADEDDDDDDFGPMQLMLAENFGIDIGNDDRFDHPARGFALQEMLFRNRERMRQRHQEVEYKREYTHPGQPESGFTFDFAPPEPSPGVPTKPAPIVIDLEALDSDDTPVAGPSTKPAPPSPTSTEIILVCARCMDPFVLGGGLVGEEGRKKKVWALRCGHMIDGKCLDLIGNPESNVPTLEVTEVVAKALESTAGKGKGKARANDDTEAPFLLENTIRSRLRSRGHPPIMPPVAPVSTSAASSSVSTYHPPPPTTLGKRKRRASKPRIEATHEWSCPVASCGRTHASVKVDGVWVPETASTSGKGKGKNRAGAAPGGTTAGRGAIAVFV